MVIHPAKNMSFNALRDGLMDAYAKGLVSMRVDGPLALFTYTNQCVFDKQWTEFTKIARGIILDMDAKCIAALTMPKFGNYGESFVANEPWEPLPNENFEVTEKLDGSMITLFNHDGRWRCATKGSFNSEQAKWAEAWIYANLDLDALWPEDTYICEAIYASNRIVVSYDYEGLVLLTAYDGVDGEEYDRADLLHYAKEAGMRLVPIVEGSSVSDLLDIAKTLSGNEEGFVVRFQSGRRVKIKGDEYCRIHRLVSRVTPLGVFDLLAAGDDLRAVAMALPEEFQKDLFAIRDILVNQMDELVSRIEQLYALTVAMSDKDLGLWMQTQDVYPKEVARWVFPWRKNGGVGVHGDTQRQKLWSTLRPTGNVLKGYTPSNAMNRFSEEMR